METLNLDVKTWLAVPEKTEFQNQIMKEEKEYIEKQEILDAIRDGLWEIKTRRQNGEKGLTLQQLIDEL